jgi:hypothetical protein
MSSAVKVVLAVIVLAVLAGGIYWYVSKAPASTSVGEETGTEQAGTSSNNDSSASLPSGASTADVSLDQDLGAIDTQLNAFASDNTSVDQSLNDTPVSQSSI